MFKRIFSLLTALTLLTTVPLNSKSAVINKVLESDIGAFVDMQPIESYNVDGYTYVCAEDLADYGFDIIWSEQARTLYINRNKDKEFVPMKSDKINRLKSDVNVGRVVYDVYETNVVAYADNEFIHSYNIDGKLVIKLRDMEKYGYIVWDAENKKAQINLLRKEFDNEFEKYKNAEPLVISSDQVFSSPEEKPDWTWGNPEYKFIGKIVDGKPNGIGQLIKKWDLWAMHKMDLVYYNHLTVSYYGNFVNGVPDGRILYRYDVTLEPYFSEYNKEVKIEGIQHYKSGSLNGLFSKTESIDGTRTDSIYLSGQKNGFNRDSKIDQNYLYGFRVEKEGDYSQGERIRYELDASASKFVKVEKGIYVDDFLSENPYTILTNENGKKFYINHSRVYDIGVVDTMLKRIPIDQLDLEPYDTSKYLEINEKGTLIQHYSDEKDIVICDNVASFSGDLTMSSRIQILKKDGTLLFARLEWPNITFGDGSDLTKPIKVADNVISQSTGSGLNYYFIKNDHSLYSWGVVQDGRLAVTVEKAEEIQLQSPKTLIDFVNIAPENAVKILDDVAKIEAQTLNGVALKNDGTLWTWGSDMYGVYGDLDGNIYWEPYKIMDNVSDFVVNGNAVIVIKKDGTVWSFGAIILGQSTDPEDLPKRKIPQQITSFYHVLPDLNDTRN